MIAFLTKHRDDPDQELIGSEKTGIGRMDQEREQQSSQSRPARLERDGVVEDSKWEQGTSEDGKMRR